MAAGGGGPLVLLTLLVAGVAARLYRAGEDPLSVLAAGTVRRALLNSSAAWVVQFYSSSCGHCVAFAPTWRALAGDVKGEGPALAGVCPAGTRCEAVPPGSPSAWAAGPGLGCGVTEGPPHVGHRSSAVGPWALPIPHPAGEVSCEELWGTAVWLQAQ